MIKKLGNKGLFLILIILVGVFLLFRYISNRKGENTFKTALVPKIDSGKLNKVVIYPKMEDPGSKDKPWKKPLPFIFTKNGKNWDITQGDVTSRAVPRSYGYMISQLEQINPDRLGANDPKDWKQYCVNDTLGTRLIMFYDKDTILDVIIGRFSYIPQQKEAISYVRLTSQKEVYAIPGYLSMNMANEFDNWRDKKIMPGEVANWNRLTYSYPAEGGGDSSFVIKKDSGGRWVFENDDALPDSVTAVKAIQEISSQNYGVFVNKYDSTSKKSMYSLKIEGTGFSPVVIKAFQADTANGYAINSTLNHTAFFSGKKGDMFNKIFRGKSYFDIKESKPAAKKRKK